MADDVDNITSVEDRVRGAGNAAELVEALSEARRSGLYEGDTGGVGERVLIIATERAAQLGRHDDPVAAANFDAAVEKARDDQRILARAASAAAYWHALSGLRYGSCDPDQLAADAYQTSADFLRARKVLTFQGSRIRHGGMNLGANLKKAVEATRNGHGPVPGAAEAMISELREAALHHVRDVAASRKAELVEAALEVEPEGLAEIAHLVDVATPHLKKGTSHTPEDLILFMEAMSVPANATPGRTPEPSDAPAP